MFFLDSPLSSGQQSSLPMLIVMRLPHLLHVAAACLVASMFSYGFHMLILAGTIVIAPLCCFILASTIVIATLCSHLRPTPFPDCQTVLSLSVDAIPWLPRRVLIFGWNSSLIATPRSHFWLVKIVDFCATIFFCPEQLVDCRTTIYSLAGAIVD
jgi:hypothetical protein